MHDYQSRLGADGEGEYGITSTDYITDKENLYVGNVGTTRCFDIAKIG